MIEIRRNDDDSIDEVIARDEFVHLEQMSKDSWYLGIGDEYKFSIYRKGKRVEVMVYDSPLCRK
jgi:hypothetical protein